MTISNIGLDGVSRVINDLSKVVDFRKDLPANVFIGNDFKFWFFERPLLDYVDLFAELVSENFSNYNSKMFIKFSGGELLSGSCFLFTEGDAEKDVVSINEGFKDFFCGSVGYPIVIFNEAYDWVAFESAYEELGVIAVKEKNIQKRFAEYLELNFVSEKILTEWAADESTVESSIAKAFLKAFYNYQF